MGNVHAALRRKVEHLKWPFFSSLTFTSQSQETPFLTSPALEASFNGGERESHVTRSEPSALLAWKLPQMKHEIGVTLLSVL